MHLVAMPNSLSSCFYSGWGFTPNAFLLSGWLLTNVQVNNITLHDICAHMYILYITSALLFFSSFYTSSNLLGRVADSDPSHQTQLHHDDVIGNRCGVIGKIAPNGFQAKVYQFYGVYVCVKGPVHVHVPGPVHINFYGALNIYVHMTIILLIPKAHTRWHGRWHGTRWHGNLKSISDERG
jgi:hypothetical protein